MAKKAGVRKESKCVATCPACILYDTKVIPTAGRRCSGSWGGGSRSRNHLYITTELLLLLLNSSGCQRPSYDCVTEFSISGEALKLIATGSRQILLIIKHKRDDLRGRRRSAYQHGHCMPLWRMPQLNKRTAERLCQKTAHLRMADRAVWDVYQKPLLTWVMSLHSVLLHHTRFFESVARPAET